MSSSSSHFYCSLLRTYCETHNRIRVKKIHCSIITSLKNPETFLLNNLISSYHKLGNLIYARKVFDRIPQQNLFSWNSILSAYSKSGYLLEMRKIFYRMPARDGVTWNSVISGYACHGSCDETVEGYKLMLKDGPTHLNRITFSTMFSFCSSHGFVDLGKQIHGRVVVNGVEDYTFVGSTLVDMYSKVGLIYDARRVFNELPERNVVMYNTMIMGFLRCGMIEDSEYLFRFMPEKDSISWTTMITGLMQNGLDQSAVNKFREMSLKGLCIDQFTFGSILTACGGLAALREGKQIHAFIINTNYKDNVFVGSALVDMYLKCKGIQYAERVFKRMNNKNIVSWTAMIVGYGQNGYREEAVRIFCDMQRNGIEPDDFTIGSIVSSCANLAGLEEGAQFHCQALV